MINGCWRSEQNVQYSCSISLGLSLVDAGTEQHWGEDAWSVDETEGRIGRMQPRADRINNHHQYQHLQLTHLCHHQGIDPNSENPWGDHFNVLMFSIMQDLDRNQSNVQYREWRFEIFCLNSVLHRMNSILCLSALTTPWDDLILIKTLGLFNVIALSIEF